MGRRLYKFVSKDTSYCIPKETFFSRLNTLYCCYPLEHSPTMDALGLLYRINILDAVVTLFLFTKSDVKTTVVPVVRD